ncbi:hypothetical protein SAMN02910456_02449 [Ruminococcaceae bacterium YRB3002]|nr:hypothetical protein SAMN02910456_02449 [Ruminococcaceae bacterium YRB3002]
MEQQEVKKRRVRPVIWVILAAVVLLFALVFLVPVFARNLLPGMERYASDYDLEVGETKLKILGEWCIEKVDNDGVISLQIRNRSSREDNMDKLCFVVYDAAPVAHQEYLKLYDELKDCIQEEGSDWFTAWMPNVYDAEILNMYYLEDNMIIYTELEVISEWPLPQDGEYESDRVSDYTYLKDYIIYNNHEIRDYVINTIMPGQIPPDRTREEVLESFRQELTDG